MSESGTYQITHFIDGEHVGQPEQERRNPAHFDDLVSKTALGETAIVDKAVAAAARAQTEWASMSPISRGAILTRASELLADRIEVVANDLTREEGKTLAEARGEVARAAEIFRFFGGEGWRQGGDTYPSATANTLVYSQREALGVVGLITPWNFPIAIPAWKAAPALLSGNTVVIKPAGLTPVSVWHLTQVLRDAGLPNGVWNVVHGKGAVVGDALVEHPQVAAISFTGSTSVGRGIYWKAASRMARVQLEMGGKNALVILGDADAERAAQIAAAGSFGLTGQACTATSRIICASSIHDEFVSAFEAEAKRYSAGDGQLDGTLMGPVVSQRQLQTNREYVEIATAEGAKVISVGKHRDGLMFDPVIMTNVEPDDRIAQEEVFGPVAGVLKAKDFATAVELTNSSTYGLSAGLVTNDLRAAQRFANEVEAGVIKVNRPTGGVDLNVPFGGVKDSSTNTYREQGATAVDFYTWVKSVYLGFD